MLKEIKMFNKFIKTSNKNKIKIIESSYVSKKNKSYLSLFIRLMNNSKNKKQFSSIINENIIKAMCNYLIVFGGKDIYLLIYSLLSKNNNNKVFFINYILGNKNIDITGYYEFIKKDVKNIEKKYLSEKEKTKLINKINYKNKIQYNKDAIKKHTIINNLLSEQKFNIYIDNKIKNYKSYKKNSAGFLFALNDMIFNSKKYKSFKIIKKEIIKSIPSSIDINSISTATLNYGNNRSQEISFTQYIEHTVCCYRLAQQFILKEKMRVFFDYKNDFIVEKYCHNQILENSYIKINNYNITNDEVKIILECIYAYLCGYHKVIFGVLPIIENIYKKAYKFKENDKISDIVLSVPQLYENEMVRNLFLKNTQLIENKKSSNLFSLNIKNDFFHYKFVDDELIDLMSMYVFEYLLKDFLNIKR